MSKKLMVAIVLGMLCGAMSQAAVITAPVENPTVGIFDVAQLLYSDLDTTNVRPGDGDDEWAYVANDRETQGQTFALSSGAKLEGIWIKHVSYGTYHRFATGQTATVRVCSVSGSTLTVLRSETATVAAGYTELGGQWGGSNRWIYIALDTPVILAGAGTYAFDVTAPAGSDFCVEIAGVGTNPYAGGTAYTTAQATQLGLEIARPHVDGDRTFILNLSPAKVSPIAPAPGAVNVPLDQILSWQVHDTNVASIDLYFDSDPNLFPSSKRLTNESASTTSWNPQLAGGLDPAITWYWRIDAYEPNAIEGEPDIKTVGEIWSFTTVGESAVVSAVSPAKRVVDKGTASIELSVTAVNTTSYQWYKEAGETDIELNDAEGVFAGTDTDTLTIYDVQQDDEGQYYCQADNDLSGTEPVNSVPGLVMTKRLIIHYPLDTVDGTTTPDIVGGYNMTLSSADTTTDLPTLASGVPQLGGNCLLFDNRGSADPNFYGQYATAGDVDMEALGDGLTVAFWAQWVGNNGDWQGMINRRGTWSAADMMWRIDKDPTSGAINFTREGLSGPGTDLVQGAWHYIVATYDSASGTTKMYNNGVRMATGSGFTYGAGVNSGFKLGANDDGGTGGLFWGMIDDVKIYNYARSAVQIAQDYANIMNTSVCNREGTADMEFDTNDDCKIDLTDFAEVAADWLNNNRIYQQ